MTLTYDKAFKRFVWHGDFANKHLPKEARFRWNPKAKCWWTDDRQKAIRLLQFADDSAQAVLDPVVATRTASHADAPTTPDAIPAPEGLAYRPFQISGIEYASSRPATLIADEMGLGKTVQTVGLINADPTLTRSLIVCPASLRLNWQRELERWLVRDLSIGIATTQDWPDTDIVICNYDIIWRAGPLSHAAGETWDLVVLDESHYVKNPKAKRTKAVVGDRREPGLQARRKLALTGTPVTNRPIELYSTLRWLDSASWPSFMGYAKRYCAAHQTRFGWDFTGASHLSELQDTLRQTVMVRRLKKDVLTELPAKTRQVIEVPPNGAAAAVDRENAAWDRKQASLAAHRRAVANAQDSGDADAYRLAVKALREAEGIAFSEMSKVRADTAVAKLPAVLAHVKDALEASGGKVVVMAHHHEVVDGLLAGLSDYQPVTLTGRTPMADRQAAVDRFQSDPDCRVFVGGILAAGVGITLTASAHVVFAELDWVPGNVSQAEDRCHRIGQTDPVLVQHLVIDGSLDARMAHMIVDKQAVIDAALDDEPDRTLVVHTPTPPPPPLPDAHPDDAALVHDCLRYLAGRCDKARELDDRGFNRFDATIGHSLANAPTLSARQYAAGLKLLWKYHRQLGEDSMVQLQAAANRTKQD